MKTLINKFNNKFQPQVDKVLNFPDYLWNKSRTISVPFVKLKLEGNARDMFAAIGTRTMDFYLTLEPLSSPLFSIPKLSPKSKLFKVINAPIVKRVNTPNVLFPLVAAGFFAAAIFINFAL